MARFDKYESSCMPKLAPQNYRLDANKSIASIYLLQNK